MNERRRRNGNRMCGMLAVVLLAAGENRAGR
jgi:hypothetical protein